MQRIVIDEQRCIAAKSARRFAVARESPRIVVARLVRAPSPAYATLLARRLSRAITDEGTYGHTT